MVFFFSFHDQIMGPTLQLATCSIKYRSNTRPRPVCTAAACLWLWLKMKPKVALTSSLCDPVDVRTLPFRFTFFLQSKLSLYKKFLSQTDMWPLTLSQTLSCSVSRIDFVSVLLLCSQGRFRKEFASFEYTPADRLQCLLATTTENLKICVCKNMCVCERERGGRQRNTTKMAKQQPDKVIKWAKSLVVKDECGSTQSQQPRVFLDKKLQRHHRMRCLFGIISIKLVKWRCLNIIKQWIKMKW